MCNHVYLNKLPISFKGKQSCPIPNVFENWIASNKDAIKNLTNIPIDSSGKCIFHSNDVDFKIQHKVLDVFKNLLLAIKYYDKSDKNPPLNLTELNIKYTLQDHEEINENLSTKEPIEFEGLHVQNTDLYFNHSTFSSKVVFFNNEFSCISFSECVFFDEVDIIGGKFGLTNFHRAEFKYYINIEDCVFKDFIDFSYAHFYKGLNIADARFEKQAIFPYCIFHKNDSVSIAKINGHFCEFTDFSGCVFEIFLIADYCIFEGEVNFTDTIFRTRLFITKPQIQSNFFIKGEKNDEDVFQDLVDFEVVPEEVTGKIIFENVSFLKINQTHKEVLFQLAQENKVEIGRGCIKYRCQTTDRTININNDKQAIILEFTQSFVNYFLRSSGYNLGIEVKNRSEDHLTYFLFSDENILQAEFENRLSEYGYNFFELFTLARNEKIDKATSNPEEAINKMDGWASLLSTFVKIGTRIWYNRWESEDTQKLIFAVNYNIPMFYYSDDFHRYIAEKFDPKSITNVYKIKELVGIKLDRPTFNAQEVQLADKIENKESSISPKEQILLAALKASGITEEEILLYIEKAKKGDKNV